MYYMFTYPIVSKIKHVISHIWGGTKIALDLGTSNTRIGIHEKGVVIREPTYIALNTKNSEYLFFGIEAKEMYGKAPHFIHIIKPMRDGVVSDFDAEVALMRHFFQKAVYPFFSGRNIVKSKLIGYTVVPTSSTEVEQKAIQEALIKAGLHEVHLIEKPIACALGAHLPIFSNTPYFVIDLGGGLVEMVVITMGGIVAQKIFKNAGEHMDKLIHNYIHLKYGLLIGEATAEFLKTTLLRLDNQEKVETVRGKSLENGLPKSIRVKSGDIKEALVSHFNHIINMAKELIETVPPEIIDGIMKNGIVLTGQLAHVPGIESFIETDLKVPVKIAPSPQDATINGILLSLSDKKNLSRLLLG